MGQLGKSVCPWGDLFSRLRPHSQTLDWAERPATDKHSSLFGRFVNYGLKIFMALVLVLFPRTQTCCGYFFSYEKTSPFLNKYYFLSPLRERKK